MRDRRLLVAGDFYEMRVIDENGKLRNRSFTPI